MIKLLLLIGIILVLSGKKLTIVGKIFPGNFPILKFEPPLHFFVNTHNRKSFSIQENRSSKNHRSNKEYGSGTVQRPTHTPISRH